MERNNEGFLASMVFMGTTMHTLGRYTNDYSMKRLAYTCFALTGIYGLTSIYSAISYRTKSNRQNKINPNKP